MMKCDLCFEIRTVPFQRGLNSSACKGRNYDLSFRSMSTAEREETHRTKGLFRHFKHLRAKLQGVEAGTVRSFVFFFFFFSRISFQIINTQLQ